MSISDANWQTASEYSTPQNPLFNPATGVSGGPSAAAERLSELERAHLQALLRAAGGLPEGTRPCRCCFCCFTRHSFCSQLQHGVSGAAADQDLLLVNQGWQPKLAMQAGEWQRWRLAHTGYKRYVDLQVGGWLGGCRWLWGGGLGAHKKDKRSKDGFKRK